MKRSIALLASAALLASLLASPLALAQPIPVKVTAPARPSGPAEPPSAVPVPEPVPAHAFDPALSFLPKDPTAKVSLMLEDADLTELVRTIGEITGKRFVVATSKSKGIKATVFAPQKLSVAEAYAAFLAVLQANGLTVLPDGALLKVVDAQDITKQVTPVARVGEPATPEERYVTRIVRLTHVSADEVAANVLSKFSSRDGSVVPYPPGNLLILTDTGDNLRRMTRILEDIDVGSSKDQVYFEPLYYVPAADLDKRLSEVFDLKGDAAAKPQGATPATGEAHVSKIVPLEHPNALVIVATESGYRRLLELVKRMDVSESSEGQIHVVPLQYADAKKIVGALNEALGGAGAAMGTPGSPKTGAAGPMPVLEQPAKISAEETTNALIITSTARDYAAILDVVRRIDKPRRQVYIEAVVMDVSLTRGNAFGVAYHGASPETTDKGNALLYGGLDPLKSVVAPNAADPTSLQGLALGLKGPDSGITLPGPNGTGISVPSFGVLLNAYASTTDADILSTPHILASDNTPAEIKVQLNTALQKNAQSFQFPSSGGTSPVSSGFPVVSGTPQYGKIGPRIKVTPHLNESDEVRLDVDETISDLVQGDGGTLGTVSYLERAATTTLTVKDQQTVVIGGLVRDKIGHTQSKIPILGDIPLLGALFRSSTETVEKSNLVLVLTPYIIRDQEDLRNVFERKMQERQEFLDHYMVFSDHAYEPAHDWERAQGLLGVIRHEYRDVDERAALAAMGKREPPKTHEGEAPIEMPALGHAPASAPASVQPHAAVPAAATKPVVEQIER